MGPVAAETTLASTPSATHDPKHDAAALQAVGGLWGCIANPGGTPSPTFYRASRNAIATTVIDSMTNESRRGGDLSRICFPGAPVFAAVRMAASGVSATALSDQPDVGAGS